MYDMRCVRGRRHGKKPSDNSDIMNISEDEEQEQDEQQEQEQQQEQKENEEQQEQEKNEEQQEQEEKEEQGEEQQKPSSARKKKTITTSFAPWAEELCPARIVLRYSHEVLSKKRGKIVYDMSTPKLFRVESIVATHRGHPRPASPAFVPAILSTKEKLGDHLSFSFPPSLFVRVWCVTVSVYFTYSDVFGFGCVCWVCTVTQLITETSRFRLLVYRIEHHSVDCSIRFFLSSMFISIYMKGMNIQLCKRKTTMCKFVYIEKAAQS
jgi:flagellar biosynthesis GTPase FlhF